MHCKNCHKEIKKDNTNARIFEGLIMELGKTRKKIGTLSHNVRKKFGDEAKQTLKMLLKSHENVNEAEMWLLKANENVPME